MNDNRDQRGGGERDQREATPVEKRLGFVEPDAEPDEPTERGEAGDVEQL